MHFKNLYVVQLLFVSLFILPFVFGGHAYSRLKESDLESEKGNLRTTPSSSSNQANIPIEPPKIKERKLDKERISKLEWVESFEKDVQHILTTCESIDIAEWKKEPEFIPRNEFQPVRKVISTLRSDIKKEIRSKKPFTSSQSKELIGDLDSLTGSYIELIFEEALKLFELFLNDYSSKIHVLQLLAKPEDQAFDFVANDGPFPGPVKVTVSDKRITFEFPFISATKFLEEYNIKDNLKLVEGFNQVQSALENFSLNALRNLFKKALLQYCEKNGLKSQQNEDS